MKDYVVVQNLTKDYIVYERNGFRRLRKRVNALQGIDLTLEKGSFMGYIGPNGAGKSTTVKILTGIMTPDRGVVQVGQWCPWKDRKRYVKHIGVVFGQKTQLWWDLPVSDTYQLLRSVYGVDSESFRKRMRWVCDMLEIEGFFHQPVRQLSLGQRMRAELGASVLHRPEVLFLDEPTLGLDLLSKHRVLDFLRAVHDEGTTIFLTTHDLKEIEVLCQSILVLNKGKIVFHGAVSSLKRLVPLVRHLIATLGEGQEEIEGQQKEELSRMGGCYDSTNRQITIPLAAGKNPTEPIRFLLSRFDIHDFQIAEPGIEEVVKQIYLA